MRLTKCSVELYGYWQGDKRTSHRLSVVLFHAWRGGPAEMGPVLTSSLTEAATFLKRPGSTYYWNAEDVAAFLIARGLAGPGFKGPRFSPCLEVQRSSEYLWRIYLLPQASSEVTCHQLQWNERNALEQLYPVDWRNEAAKEKRR